MVSCYEDDKIIPTEDPLASAGGIVFPQGNNSWDKDALDIYNQYGVKILYKDCLLYTSPSPRDRG